MAERLKIEMVAARRRIAGIGTFAVHSSDPETSVHRRLRRRALASPMGRLGLSLAAALAVGATVGGLASLGANARSVEPPPAPVKTEAPSPTPSEASSWIDIVRPLELYDLAGTDFAKLPLTYKARRRQDASERQDVLSYGEFASDKPFLMISILRADRQAPPARFFVDMARLAGDGALGIVSSGLPDSVPTRFGAFETADLSMRSGTQVRACLGFRPQSDPAGHEPVVIEGLACGVAKRPMDREALACTIGRVDLLAAGDDSALQRFFVEAERRRGAGCGSSRLLAAGARETWLDGGAVQPPLRPSKAAR